VTKPSRAPTHSPIDITRLMKLAGELEEVGDDSVVTAEAIDELAEDNGVERSHYYAALPLADLSISDKGPLRAVACVGGCQGWGAIDAVDALLELRDERETQGKSLVVSVSGCLDMCEHAAVVELRTDSGTAMVAQASPSSLRASVSELDADS